MWVVELALRRRHTFLVAALLILILGGLAAYQAPKAVFPLGAIFLLVSNHTLMHAGHFTGVRRALGKPVLF